MVNIRATSRHHRFKHNGGLQAGAGRFSVTGIRTIHGYLFRVRSGEMARHRAVGDRKLCGGDDRHARL